MKNFFLLYILFSFISPKIIKGQDLLQGKNLIKTNLPALGLKNFNLQYERVLNKRFSAALGLGYIPQGALPLKNIVETSIPSEGNDYLNQLQVGYFSLTPEVRLYLGKGHGRGFYFAPYFRYNRFNIGNLKTSYETDLGETRDLNLAGDIKGNSFGMMMGVNFTIFKIAVLDLWIIGGHYGTSSGKLAADSDLALSLTEQGRLKTSMQDIDIPFVEEEITVSANSAKLQFKGPWSGLRSGVSLGIRF